MPTPGNHTSAIPASKVIGMQVYDAEGNSIGTVKDVMLDKRSNSIMFAVIAFGGALGIGEKYHAVPWSSLDYQEDRGGYVVSFGREQLDAAPAYSVDELTLDDGRAARDASYDYYKVDPYWS